VTGLTPLELHEATLRLEEIRAEEQALTLKLQFDHSVRKGGRGESPEPFSPYLRKKRQGLPVCGGKPEPLAAADWLEELAVYGTPRRICDQEIAYQLSLVIENWYLVRLALRFLSILSLKKPTKQSGLFCAKMSGK
jgi:hypothetical protein